MDDTKNTNISISNDNENHLVNDNDSSKTKSDDDIEQEEIKKSTLNLAGLLGPTHPGRPANEEPHVKKTMKNKKEKIELICRVDQEELGFDEDEFEDLKALFLVRYKLDSSQSIKMFLNVDVVQLFDYDQDGVVNKKEGQAMLRCLGLATDEERMAVMVSSVGVDTSHHSLSFNEFLSLVSRQRREEPSDQGLVTAFR